MSTPSSRERAAHQMLRAQAEAVTRQDIAANFLDRAGNRIVAAAREHGLTWGQIALDLGYASGDAARKRFERGGA